MITAAVAWGPGEELVIEEVELSPPQAMEIRIKVVCTSLCRSDLTAWQSKVLIFLSGKIVELSPSEDLMEFSHFLRNHCVSECQLKVEKG